MGRRSLVILLVTCCAFLLMTAGGSPPAAAAPNRPDGLSFSVSASPSTVIAGNNLTYAVSFKVTGSAPSSFNSADTKWSTTLDSNQTFVSISKPSRWNCTTPQVGTSGSVNCNLVPPAVMSLGETDFFQLTVRVASSAVSSVSLSFDASATDGVTTDSANDVVASATVTQEADVKVAKSAPQNADAGGTLQYTVTVANNGPSDASNVAFSDALPSFLNFQSLVNPDAVNWTCLTPSVGTNGTVSCTRLTLAAGASQSFTIVTSPSSLTPNETVITNVVDVSTSSTDTDSTNDEASAATTIRRQADVVVYKVAANDPVKPGQSVIYKLRVVNNGPSVSSGLTLTDRLPNVITSASATNTPAGWTCSSFSGGVITCSLTSPNVLTPGQIADFDITATVGAATPLGTNIVNTASIVGAEPDPVTANNSVNVSTLVAQGADVAVTKAGAALAQPAQNLTYQIVVVNNGPDAATNVTLQDTLPPSTTFVSLSNAGAGGWTCANPGVGNTGAVSCTNPSLAVGATTTFTLVVNVGAGVALNTQILNTATVSAATTDPVTTNNSSTTSTTTVSSAADVDVTKSAPQAANAGGTLQYVITVNNNGPLDASNVAFSDALPSGLLFQSLVNPDPLNWLCLTPPTGSSGTVSCQTTTLLANDAQTFTIVTTVDPLTPNDTVVTNAVTVSTSTTDANAGNDRATTNTIIRRSADLVVTKVAASDPVKPGQTFNYTLRVVNNGPSIASAVQLTDLLPSAVTTATATGVPSGWTCGPLTGGAITCSLTSPNVLNPGQITEFTIAATVGAGTALNTTLVNTASAVGAEPDPVTANNSVTITTLVAQGADLAVTKTAPALARPGQNVTYHIVAVNNGPDAATSVTLNDTLPSGTTFVSLANAGAGGWTCATPAVGSSGAVSCTNPTLAAGAATTFTLVVKVDAGVALNTQLVNTALISGATSDPVTTNNSATATTTVVLLADLVVTKTDAPDPVIAGANVSYGISVVNNGPDAAANVTISDALPTGTTFVSLTSPAGWSCATPAVGANGTVTCSLASLSASGTANFVVVVKTDAGLADGATLLNTAIVTSNTPDPNLANNSSTTATTVITRADLAVTKSDTPDPVQAGATISYAINVSNNGPSNAQSVTVNDPLPSQTSFVAIVCAAGWLCATPAVNANGTLTLTKTGLAPGETATFTLSVKVDPATAQGTNVSNTATVTATTPDPVTTNNSATTNTAVIARADIRVTKTDSPDPVNAGANLTYTINVINNGPSVAQDVTLVDVFPSADRVNLTFVSLAAPLGWACETPGVGAIGEMRCTNPTVAPGTSTFSLVLFVPANTPLGTTFTNTATATSSATPDPFPANNTSIVQSSTGTTSADLALTKTDSPDPVLRDFPLTYSLSVVNNGPSDAQNVKISDTLAPLASFVSATPSAGGACTTPPVGASGTVSCTWSGATGPTTVRSVNIVVRLCSGATCAASVSNTASATSDSYDPTTSNNSQTATTTLAVTSKHAVWRALMATFFLREMLTSGPATLVANFGRPGDTPLMCDWDGNGTKTLGVVRGNAWFLRNSNTTGVNDVQIFQFGDAIDKPVCGDWDGNGTETPGVFRNGTWLLRNSTSGGLPDIVLQYGQAGDAPVVGDWDGNGTDTVGVVRGGLWYLRNSNLTGFADVVFAYGAPTDTPIVGDWDGNGTDTPGVVRGGLWYLRNSNSTGVNDIPQFAYGDPGDTPLVWK